MKTKEFVFLFGIILVLFASCAEAPRYDINSDDKVPPAAPVVSRYEPLNGAVQIFYTPPADRDVISVDARYTRKSDGKVFRYSTSYFSNSILVFGLADTIVYDIQLYAVDRAGNHSPEITVQVKPLESALMKVKRSMIIKGGFDALFAKWENELRDNVNVLVDYSFTLNGASKSFTKVFTSATLENRYYIPDLDIPPTSPIKVSFRVTDDYDNSTVPVEIGNLYVLKDTLVPKFDADRNPLWTLPESRTIPLAEYGDNVMQVFGNDMDGHIKKVVDGTIDQDNNLNYLYTGHPFASFYDPSTYWNVMIDLGKEYELSRILTHQRHTAGGYEADLAKRGAYYQSSNVGRYRMYRWDNETNKWDTISMHRIPMPQGMLADLEWNRLGRAGDIAYMYPDDPKYTKPTRWFRYEAMSGFGPNYSDGCGSLSEITLYCKKQN
ncbi:MAG: DUF4959 domain-containing protein [Prevotellaceae bacterium]|jgi:hypothetical protein|nr:DUF4959 domain-containing protein [Prevotellaceae bacterium]